MSSHGSSRTAPPRERGVDRPSASSHRRGMGVGVPLNAPPPKTLSRSPAHTATTDHTAGDRSAPAPGSSTMDLELKEMVRSADRRMEALNASTDSAGTSVPGSPGLPSSDVGGARAHRRGAAQDSTPLGSDADDASSDDFDGHRKLRRSHISFRTQAAQHKADLRLAKEAFSNENTLLREQLDAARSRQLMVEQKMAALDAGHQDMIRAIHARTKDDLETLQGRLHLMEAQTPTHRQLMHKVGAAVDAASAVASDEQYSALLEIPHSELQPAQLATIKLHELTLPLRQQLVSQQRQIGLLAKRKSAIEVALAVANERVEHLAAGKLDADAALARVRTEDHRVAHLDELARSHAESIREADVLRGRCVALESRLEVAEATRKDVEVSGAEAIQRLEVIQMDKEHLARANTDLEANITHVSEQLRETRAAQRELTKSREDAYERLLHAKSELTAESERVVQQQVAEIRDKTAAELVELRSSARQMFEQEARGYRNERDSAIAARRQLEFTCADMTERHETLNTSYHELQMTSESRASDLTSQLRLKSFECERLQVLLREAQTSLTGANLEVQKQQEKVAVATREYLELKATTNAHIAVLETRTGGDRATLDAYEKLERELDQVVMQAADAADPTETLLGYGQHIPGTAKRRLKQGVMLARKLLAAQRELKRSQEDAATLRQKVTELEDELNQSNGLLTNVRTQPHQVLVEDLRQRDRSAKELRTKLNDMTTKASRLEAENVELLQVQNAMSSDLERLLDSEGEMREMRVALADLQSASHHQQQQKPPAARRPGVAVSRSSGRRRGVGAT